MMVGRSKSSAGNPRIVNPRGFGINQVDNVVIVNSGSNRILALDRNGVIVRTSRTVDGLNPGGGNFGLDGRYYVGLRDERTVVAFARELNSTGELSCRRTSFGFPAVLPSRTTAGFFSPRVSDRVEKATISLWRRIRPFLARLSEPV
jgi:hypothetical protein